MALAARELMESSGSFPKGRMAATEGSKAAVNPHCLQRPAETPGSPLQTMPAPPISVPGQEEQGRQTDQLEAAAQECPVCP